MNTLRLTKHAKTMHSILLICIYICVVCCSDNLPEGGEKPVERSAELASIEDIMRLHYFWDTEIPASSRLDYSKSPTDFFNSMLSSKDGKDGYHYSYIEEYAPKTRVYNLKYSYGFEFHGFWVGDEIYTLVLYVVPNTPASEAGLKRGDWIVAVDGKPITSNDEFQKFIGDVAHEFMVKTWSAAKNTWISPRKLSISAARAIEENPVFLHKTLTTQKGTKVGYLVYNRFAFGPDEEDTANEVYDDALRQASIDLKNDGVQELVLDLRYNPGGALSSAILLSLIVANAQDLGKNICELRYNKQNSKKNEKFPLYEGWLTNEKKTLTGQNLNLKRLYILTSEHTASASELIINCMRPFYKVILIGEQTEGKNVGSVAYKTDDEKWMLHPIVSQIFNSKGESDYVNGFKPDYAMNEVYMEKNQKTYIQDMYELGDSREFMLSVALNHIDTDAFTRAVDTHSADASPIILKKLPFCSLDRKATPGVIINK